MATPSRHNACVSEPESTTLRDLEVLLVDCQTSGATPSQGSVLELAWCRTRAAAVGTDLHSTRHGKAAPLRERCSARKRSEIIYEILSLNR